MTVVRQVVCVPIGLPLPPEQWEVGLVHCTDKPAWVVGRARHITIPGCLNYVWKSCTRIAPDPGPEHVEGVYWVSDES